MRARVRDIQRSGLVLKPLFGRPFTVAFGEILTAERLRGARALMLHTRTTEPVKIVCRHSRLTLEDQLRRSGVRIVDCWGAMITPALEDFEQALEQEPKAVRQSYDNA